MKHSKDMGEGPWIAFPVLKLLASAALAAALVLSSHASASVTEGINQLAGQIVARSVAADRTTIAIAAFPHVNDTCSELSNFLVDELVLSFFSMPDNQLSIIERSQLDRIFSELELSLSGAVDANTTQELGRVHGVQTLLVGTLSTVGDHLRVNARLIDTETARVYSAAAVNVPLTSTFEDLMRRPAAGGCTMRPSGSRGAGQATAAPGRTFTGFQGELEMSSLEGLWSGTITCDGNTEPRSLRLTDANPAGLHAEYWHRARPSGGPNRTNMAYAFQRAAEGIWFTLALAGGVPLQLISDGVLFGEYENSDGQKCELYLGKID